MLADVEAVHKFHLLQNLLHRGRSDDHELAICIRWLLLDQNQESLEDGVAKARSNMNEFDKALQVVQDDERERRLVGIFEDLDNLADFTLLGIANEVLGSDHLDVGELTLQGQLGGKSGLS